MSAPAPTAASNASRVSGSLRRISLPIARHPSLWSSPGLTRGSNLKHRSRMAGYVYIVTNRKRGTLYIGVTSDLERRIFEHRKGKTPGFTSKYGCNQRVWYEEHQRIGTAIQREKSLKRWYQQWKIELIEKVNPDWRDLYFELW